MRTRTLWFVLLAGAACSKKLDGPTPQISKLDPDAVCVEQLTTTLTVSGSGFAPLEVSALTNGKQLQLPKVELLPAKSLSGGAASGGPFTFPDDPSKPADSTVHWTSAAALTATVSPGLKLPTALYDLEVTNPQGAAHTLPGALLAVPPPSLTALSQDIACTQLDNHLTVTGADLIKSASAGPTLTVGSLMLTPALDGCEALPGNGGYSACSSASFDLAKGSLMAGSAQVSLKNPSPVQCGSTSLALYLFDAPTVTSADPLAICTASNDTMLRLTGTGFVTVDGAAPTVTVGGTAVAVTASNCLPVAGPKENVQVCTELSFTIAQGMFPVGSYPLTVTNPAQVGCSAQQSFTLVVAPPPVISSVAPMAVCAGSPTLTLTGTGFQPGATAELSGISATTVTVAGSTSAVASFPGGVPTGGPYAVTLTNPDGCSASSTATVNVIPGPQLFFVDPPVVYNGITVRATAYGTGFTGAVQSVSLLPPGGGAPIPLTFNYDAARANQVQLDIPQGTAAGTYGVQLNDMSACPAVLMNAVKVVDQAALALSTPPVVPAFGWTGSPTAVTVFSNGGFAAVPRVYLNPHMPGPMTVATGLGAVSFVDASHLTAVVPTPALPAGDYDLIVVDPDGTVGFAASAFSVVAQAPPTITGLNPGSVPNGSSESVQVLGADFRMPQVSLSCIDATGTVVTNVAATVTTSTATTVDFTFNASLAGAACVVRVTDQDNSTFADYSALVITNPAQNLYAPDAGPELNVGRRAPVALGGNATNAARFLHVVGGDDGDGGTALGSVESSPLSLFGVPGPFVTQKNALVQPRAFAGGAQLGRYLYVAGGSSNGTRLDSVERAAVLDPNLRESVTDLRLDASRIDGLGAGVWYYRVAAVMGPNDPFNPNGENLPSDPFPVQLPDISPAKVEVTVFWSADPNAVKYRVYRSATAGAPAGSEQVIAEVMAPMTSFQDLGGAPVSTDTPLTVGSTGVWQTLAAHLAAPREGPGVAWALDPADPTQAYLYVLGGRDATGTALNSYELLPLKLNADGSQTPAMAFTAGSGTIGTARWQLGAARGSHELSPRIAAGSEFIYTLSGVASNGTTLVNQPTALPVQAGGQLGTRVDLPILGHAGYYDVVAGNFVFAFGGKQAGPDATVVGGEICAAGVAGCATTPNPPNVVNWNAGQAMAMPRYLHGGALSGAYIYIAGGLTTGGAVTKSTEYRLW